MTQDRRDAELETDIQRLISGRFGRRAFVVGGAAFAAAAVLRPGGARAAGAIDDLYAAAKPEGEITWYVVPYSSETAEKVGAAFTEAFPGIKVNVVRSTASVAWQRLNQDIDTGVHNCDVLTTSNVAHAADLKGRGLLSSYTPLRKEEVIASFRDADPDEAWLTTGAGPMCIVYNTDKVSEADAPKNWPDLLDPKWKGKVAIGHPGFSGYVGIWAVKMRELYGWDFFEKLEAQEPHIGRSSIDVVTACASGEAWVGAGPAASSLISASKGNPVANIYPTDGTVIITSATCIMKDAPHPEAARLFVEHLLGVENAELIASEFSTPIRPGVALMPGVRSLDEIPVIQATLEQIQTEVKEVAEQFRDTFGI